VITAIDGERVDGADALVAALAGRAPGESLALTVLRKGESEPLTIDATLGARPDDEAAGWLGVEVGTLRIRIDGQGNSEHHFDMGNLHEHLRELLRGEGQDGEVDGDGPRHFRFRIGPGGDADGAPSEALELDRGGEA